MATGVQDRRNVLIRVMVEQLIDQRDDLGAGLAQLPGVERSRQGERGRRTPASTRRCRRAAAEYLRPNRVRTSLVSRRTGRMSGGYRHTCESKRVCNGPV